MFCRFFVAHAVSNITCELVFTFTNCTRWAWKYWLFSALSMGTFILLGTFTRFSLYFWITGLFLAKAVLRLFLQVLLQNALCLHGSPRCLGISRFLHLIILTEVNPIAVYAIVTLQTSRRVQLCWSISGWHAIGKPLFRAMSRKKMFFLIHLERM